MTTDEKQPSFICRRYHLLSCRYQEVAGLPHDRRAPCDHVGSACSTSSCRLDLLRAIAQQNERITNDALSSIAPASRGAALHFHGLMCRCDDVSARGRKVPCSRPTSTAERNRSHSANRARLNAGAAISTTRIGRGGRYASTMSAMASSWHLAESSAACCRVFNSIPRLHRACSDNSTNRSPAMRSGDVPACCAASGSDFVADVRQPCASLLPPLGRLSRLNMGRRRGKTRPSYVAHGVEIARRPPSADEFPAEWFPLLKPGPLARPRWRCGQAPSFVGCISVGRRYAIAARCRRSPKQVLEADNSVGGGVSNSAAPPGEYQSSPT